MAALDPGAASVDMPSRPEVSPLDVTCQKCHKPADTSNSRRLEKSHIYRRKLWENI